VTDRRMNSEILAGAWWCGAWGGKWPPPVHYTLMGPEEGWCPPPLHRKS
jgi:hypothetical protein